MRKRILAALLLVAVGAVPALANSLTFRIGYFFPSAARSAEGDDLWSIEFDQMSFVKSNFQSTAYGFDYEFFLSRNFSLLLGFDTYMKNKAGYYRDYIGYYDYLAGTFAYPLEYQNELPDTFDLVHAFNVSITPLQVGLKITPLGRRSNLIPYLSGGLTVFFWTVVLEGDIIDFNDVYVDEGFGDLEIYGVLGDSYRDDNKFSLGYHLAGGMQYVVGNRITLQAEVKYFHGQGNLTEGFRDFPPFDLSSLFISLGLNYWF